MEGRSTGYSFEKQNLTEEININMHKFRLNFIQSAVRIEERGINMTLRVIWDEMGTLLGRI